MDYETETSKIRASLKSLADDVTETRTILALAKSQVDDPVVRREGLLEVLDLINEGVEDPDLYEVMADYYLDVAPVEQCSTILRYIVRFTEIPHPRGAASQDQQNGEASNKCMRLGQILKEADRHKEATLCFRSAAIFAYGIKEDHSTAEENWITPINLAYDCAEKADGGPRGEMNDVVDEVHSWILE